jgi:hypothetical protein
VEHLDFGSGAKFLVFKETTGLLKESLIQLKKIVPTGLRSVVVKEWTNSFTGLTTIFLRIGSNFQMLAQLIWRQLDKSSIFAQEIWMLQLIAIHPSLGKKDTSSELRSLVYLMQLQSFLKGFLRSMRNQAVKSMLKNSMFQELRSLRLLKSGDINILLFFSLEEWHMLSILQLQKNQRKSRWLNLTRKTHHAIDSELLMKMLQWQDFQLGLKPVFRGFLRLLETPNHTINSHLKRELLLIQLMS